MNLYHLISKYDTLYGMGLITRHMIFISLFHIVSIVSTIVYLSIREYKEITDKHAAEKIKLEIAEKVKTELAAKAIEAVKEASKIEVKNIV